MKISKSLLIFALFAVACSSDDKDAPPSELATYLDRFVREAKARGVTIDAGHVNMRFVTETIPPGYCGYGNVNPPRVQIAQTESCWSARTDIEKEILVFHELGHAVLERSHENDTLPNGDFKSMMFDGDQFGVYSQYTPAKRKYYLDELFDQSTLTPSWANEKLNPGLVLSDTIAKMNSWTFANSDGLSQVGTVTSTVFNSAGHSLSIHADATAGNGFSFWSYNWIPSNIPVGSRVVLRVKIRRDELKGKGAYFALRGDAGNGANFFVTTQSAQLIAGTQDFTEYTLTLNYFPEQVSRMYIFLLLDGQTSGTVYFDDVNVTYYQ